MNIFAIDDSPIRSARQLPDKLIVKMPIESAQILSTAFRFLNIGNLSYQDTHHNHPAVKWAESSRSNLHWLCVHGLTLCDEYQLRYNKIHASCEVLDEAYNLLSGIYHWRDHTEFGQYMPDKYKIPGNPILAYRTYMQFEKSYYAKWKNGNKPDWWVVETKNETYSFTSNKRI